MSDISPFITEEFQAKVLAFMLQNPEFCGIAEVHLELEHFNNKVLQWFYQAIATAEHHLTPILLQEEMVRAAKNKSIQQEELSKFISIYDIIKERVIPSEEEYIKDKLGSFIRTQSVKKALIDTVDLAKNEEWDEIVGIMQNAVSSGINLEDQGYDYLGEISERVYDRATQRLASKIPTGIPDLDALMYGGIKPGQMGLIVGGTGRGKSIFLQWLARTAVLLNKKVIYFTMELGGLDIADRMDSMFSVIKPQELNDYQDHVITEITKLQNTYGKSLIIQHYPTDTATINTLKDFCRRLSQIGIVPDLICIDYLDLMRPHRTYNSEHAEIDAITKSILGFASEFNTAIWTATQLNRAGMVADTPDESGIAGSVGKQFLADIVFYMAQTKEEREDELMRLWVSKNRNGKVGTVHLETNFSYMTFYNENIIKEENDTNTEQLFKSNEESSDLQLLLQNSEQEKSRNTDDTN